MLCVKKIGLIKIEIIYPNNKLNCFKNRIYYHDCDSNYLNHLRSQKHCCSCNNLNLVFCKSKLSLKWDVGVQADFSDKQTNNYKNIDPNTLLELLRKNYSGWCNDEQSIAEAEAILGELGRVGAITCEQYYKFLGTCFVK